MNKIVLALFVCMITVNAFACNGSHDDDDKKKFESPVTLTR